MANIAELLITGTQRQTEEMSKQAQAGISDIVELGLKREQLAQSRQKLQQDMAENEAKRLEGFFTSLAAGFKLPDKNRNTYFKHYIPQRMQAFGIGPDKLNPAVLQMMMDDPNTVPIITQWREKIMRGEATVSEFEQFIGDPEIYAKYSPVMLEDYKGALQRKAQVEGQQARLASAESRFERSMDQREEQAFTNFVVGQKAKIERAMRPRQDMQVGIRNSNELLTQLENKFKNGEKLTPEERAKLGIAMEPIIRGIGQAKGPLSDADVERITGRYGIAGKWDTFKEKWITGDVSPEQIKAFKEIIQIGAKNLDKQIATEVSGFRKASNVPQFAGREAEFEQAVGFDTFQQPTLPPEKKDNQNMVDIGGKQYDKAKLVQHIQSLGDKSGDFVSKAAAQAGMTAEQFLKMLGL